MALVTRGSHVGDTNTLPKWAQRYIRDLEQARDSAQRDRLAAEKAINLSEHGVLSVRPGVTVIAQGREEETYSRAEVVFGRDGSVDIRAHRLAIEPCATNRLIVHPGKLDI